MGIIEFLFILIVIGVLLYLFQTYVPMAAPIKTIVTVIVVLLVIAFCLDFFGLWDLGGSFHHHRNYTRS
jgi:hypothetical protein